MKKSIAIMSLGLMIGCAIFLSGCTTNETGGAGVGTIRLLITDKPADLDIIYANVTISMVQVHVANTSDDEVEEEIDTNGTTKEGFTASANGKYEGNIGEDIEFFGSATDGEEPYINWSWDFGDGTVSYEQNPIHNYSTAGVFAVNLTVTDNTSATAWESTFAKIEQEEDESNTGWYTIVNESQTFDLIALQDVTELLGEKNLTAGKYTQIRLTVESAVITLNESGTIVEHALDIPSEKIKLIKPFTIVDNETTVLTLDFDVYKSIHETGSGKYIMKPTIKVIQG